MQRARRLIYVATALDDLGSLRLLIRDEAGAARANAMVERLRGAVRRYREAPLMGGPRPEYGPGCRFFVVAPYVVYYDFDGETMAVLRILHARRDRHRVMSGDSE